VHTGIDQPGNLTAARGKEGARWRDLSTPTSHSPSTHSLLAETTAPQSGRGGQNRTTHPGLCFVFSVVEESSGSRADWPRAQCSRRRFRRRSAAGTIPEQRGQGALRPARTQRADSRGDALQRRRIRKRMPLDTTKHTKQGGHPKQHGRHVRRAGGGTAPPCPRCLDNCTNNTPPNPTGQRRIATV